MAKVKSINEAEILQRVISNLSPLDSEGRLKLLQTVATFFELGNIGPEKRGHQVVATTSSSQKHSVPQFSGHSDLSPKQFLYEKAPRTDLERVACLAFYLTHYRNAPHFKTLDISKLNTEAAQVKFSNPAQAVDNATKKGFLVPATKGNKQLGVMGEQFVQALPDREATKQVEEQMRLRRSKKSKSSSPKKSKSTKR